MFDKIAFDENPLPPDLSARNDSKPRLPRQFLRCDTTKLGGSFQSEYDYRRSLDGAAHSLVSDIESIETTSFAKSTLSFGIGASICASDLGIRVEDIRSAVFGALGGNNAKVLRK